jgi:glutathione synthase/RimK-type ligase-like ATP-grasp enzyme
MKNYKQPLKLAFIGGGIDSAIGYTHYIASQMDHLFIVSAGCFSRKENINQKTALTWGVENEHLYLSWEDLLENEHHNVDAVVILTPTSNHYEMIMKALDLGYSVISEKALATTFDEGLAISNKVDEKKAFFAVTHNYTGYQMPKVANTIEDAHYLKFPLLIKPVNSFSGKGIVKVENKKELKKHAHLIKNGAIVEEFVKGELYSHSAFIKDGNIVVDFFCE